ncbi:MAG: hypothetical protein HFJ42_08790 [Clostridia bacterium]|nr:hypothetical protein [Clostridia bacterium]
MKNRNKVAILMIVLGLLLIPCALILVWAVANSNIPWMLISFCIITAVGCFYTAIGIISLK